MNRNLFAAIGHHLGGFVVVLGGLGALCVLALCLLWVLLGGGKTAWAFIFLAGAGLVLCGYVLSAIRRGSEAQVHRVLASVNERYGTSFTSKYLLHNAATLLAFDREQKKVLISPFNDHERAEIRDFDYIRLVSTDGKNLILSLSDVDRPMLRMANLFLTENIASEWSERIGLILKGR